jgi:hypothetical protein
MNADKLRELLPQRESPILEFKRKLDLYSEKGEKARRKKDELIKDILSLANGSTITVGETAYLIVGADDELSVDGTRQLYDVDGSLPTAADILKIVNEACDPHLQDIECESVEVDGRRLVVITVHPTPHLHETTRRLDTPTRSFSEYTVFVRHNESVAIASTRERDAILKLKQLCFAETRNVSPIPFGIVVGALSSGAIGASLGKKVVGEDSGQAIGGIVGALAGGTLGGLAGSMYADAKQIRYHWHFLTLPRRLVFISSLIGVLVSLQTILMPAWKRYNRWKQNRST